MAATVQVPGVYFGPHPRAPETISVRTDVVGFIGFEPRVRDGTTPSALLSNPVPPFNPIGHSFQVDLSSFQMVINGLRGTVPAATDLVLSRDPASIPIADGESIVYAIAAKADGDIFPLVIIKGIAAPSDAEQSPPTNSQIDAAAAFETQVRDGTTPSTLVGSPAIGHSFQVDVSSFDLAIHGIWGSVPAATDLVLSRDPSSIPIAVGASVVYTIVAKADHSNFTLVVIGGAAAPSGSERPPTDAQVADSIGIGKPWARIAEVTVRRNAAGISLIVQNRRKPSARIADVTVRRETATVWLTVRTALAITRLEDWRDYLLAFGQPVDDGTLLGAAVRAYFANGGRRCWVATVRRPNFQDRIELARASADMVGVAGSSELEATGLERLLLLDEVTIVDAPDLYALRVDHSRKVVKLPPLERESCFLPCDELVTPGSATADSRSPAWMPIFESSPIYSGGLSNLVFDTQKALLARCISQRWRVFLLLSVPLLPDGGSGRYVAPTAQDAQAWMRQFDWLAKAEGFAETSEMAGAALYWPWVLFQEQVDTPVLQMPPGAYAAGIVARRDLARGPQVSPANETLTQVVGLTSAFGDDIHGQLYSPPADAGGFDVPGVNVLRAFPGYGIQLWGARTLSTDTWLRYISVRRTLTAIELQMKAALDLLVFEPNTPMLWLQITHTAFGVLMPLFESGALRGTRPEEAFYVRCDSTINPPEAVAEGQLLIEVGVAVAAPAEFLVFRIGRREGVVEVLE
jgi:hypothetical protein